LKRKIVLKRNGLGGEKCTKMGNRKGLKKSRGSETAQEKLIVGQARGTELSPVERELCRGKKEAFD